MRLFNMLLILFCAAHCFVSVSEQKVKVTFAGHRK